MSRIRLTEVVEPSTPPANKVVLYVDSADSHIKQKDDTGTVTDLTSASASWDSVMHTGESFTVLDTENISATITQNDTTNNPAALVIANTGSGDDITLPNSASIKNGVFTGSFTGDVSGSSGSCTGNAATVTNATLTTALTVDTGTVGLTGNVANNSVLTIGAGASSISGTNTGDQVAGDFNHDGLASITGSVGEYNHPTDANMTVLNNTSGTNTGDNTVCTSGAATTAETLLTARTIAGVSFDGSANIAIPHNSTSNLNEDAYRHSPASVAASDFVVGEAGTGNWVKKTLAETKTLLGVTSTSPGGATTQIQYNDAGSFAGSAYLTFDAATGGITKAGKGTGNLFAGTGTGNATMTGTHNILLGDSVGGGVTSANYTVAIGKFSANSGVLSGAGNVTIGYRAGEDLATGGYNTFLGYATGQNATSASNNIAVGKNTMSVGIVTGDDNIAIGQLAGNDLTSGAYNIILGNSAGANLTTASNNIAIGKNALDAATVTTENTIAIGENAMGAGSVTGADNIAIGQLAGNNITSGSDNVSLGTQSGNSITTGSDNISIGYLSMAVGIVTGRSNVAVGTRTGRDLTSGVNNTLLGYYAGTNLTTADNTVAIGSSAIGNGTLVSDDNIAIGTSAGYALTSGANNTFIGYQAGNSVTMGSTNIIIGNDADTPAATTSNHLNIGGAIKGDLSTGKISILAAYSNDLNGLTFRDLQIKDDGELGYDSSSIVGKGDVRDLQDTSWIYNLRPVVYKSKKRETYIEQEEIDVDEIVPEVIEEQEIDGELQKVVIEPETTKKVKKIIDVTKERYIEDLYDTDQYGLISEEVMEINPLVSFYNADGSPAGVHYNKMLLIPMLAEIQKLRSEINTLKGNQKP